MQLSRQSQRVLKTPGGMFRGLCLGMSPSEVRLLEGVASVATDTHWFYEIPINGSCRLVLSLRFSENGLAHIKAAVEMPYEQLETSHKELSFALSQLHGVASDSNFMQAWNLTADDHAELILRKADDHLAISILQKENSYSSQEVRLADESGPYPALAVANPQDGPSYPASNMDSLQYTLTSASGGSISFESPAAVDNFDSVSGVRLTNSGVEDAQKKVN